MSFSEDTRVKIPALLHLTQLGYEYISLKNAVWDRDTNIFTEIFTESIRRINADEKDIALHAPSAPKYNEIVQLPMQHLRAAEYKASSTFELDITDSDITVLLNELRDKLDYEDLGRDFYKRLIADSGIRLIDFEDFDNNSFHVCTELTYKNGEDEFRPDITVLINGMPLVFIEVKKPNNPDGTLSERNRINKRFQNKKFRRFINATQFMIFSNNMEYDSDSVEPIQGAFYATVSTSKASFNCFREEDESIYDSISNLDEDVENFILKDTNLVAIKESPEYITNKSAKKPTNKIISSLLSKKRLAMILKYGIVYVDDDGVEKHIMRYPQLFATMAIEKAIDSGTNKGIIWHTQGSGKTALAYFCVPFLTSYYRRKGVVPQFYFIVDRLDLLTQAQTAFENRKLRVNIVNSRDDFAQSISKQGAIHNEGGEREITVVNIQKFSEDSRATTRKDYALNIQRVYFLDEVHRSYNPTGSFLANLMSSDPDAIIIGLTGTPLLNQKLKTSGKKPVTFNSKDVFGDYIHKYYYNLSIEDGYTLRLIREGIETKYRLQMVEILKQIEILKGSATKREVFSHPKYVTELAKYITYDFMKSRTRFGDDTIGSMVVCDTSEQAKEFYRIMNEEHGHIKAALILHDVDDKDIRKEKRDAFLSGEIDMLIVFNMLLTGFDAHRLKKLYLNRVVKDHNLLQTLTRVNRPYNNFRFGYVVDFADIRAEFDRTNAAYFEELQEEIGDEWDKYSNLFKTEEEIEEEIAFIREKLFAYDTENAERFSEQINQIEDKQIILDIKSALESAKILGNLIAMHGHDDLADRLDFAKLKVLLIEVSNRLGFINQKEALESAEDNTNLINIAIENIIEIEFKKVSENEMSLGIVDDFKEQVRKTREEMQNNFDKQDHSYVSLYEELERIFKKKKLSEMTADDINENIVLLRSIYDRIIEQNRRDALLKEKYRSDEKFARIHKRITEKKPDWRVTSILDALLGIKDATDEHVISQKAVLNNEPYFSRTVSPLVIRSFGNNALELDIIAARQINDLVVGEYLREYRGETRV